MKLFGYDIGIKKSLVIPDREEANNVAISVNGNWVSIADISNKKEFIKYGFDELDSVYAPINKIHSLMKPIKVRLKNSEGEYVDKHPILDILKDPNSRQTWNDILGYYIGFKKTTGNFYLFAEKVGSQVTGLYVLPSQYTEVLVSKLGTVYNPQLEGYKMTFNSINLKFLAEDVAHISETNLSISSDADMFYGQSPLRPLARKLRTNNGVLTSAIKLLENGGAQGMLTPHSFVVKEDAPEVTEEFLTNLKSSFREQYQGEGNAGSVILTSLPMQWMDIGMNMVDMQLFDVDKLTYKSVCNILGLKDVLFNNDDSSTYNNVRQASQDAYLQVVIPEYQELIDKLNNWLLPMYEGVEGWELCLDYNDIPEIQSYRLEQSQAYAPFMDSMTDNEVRTQILGLDPKDSNEEGFEYVDYPISERKVMSQLRFYDNGQSNETGE